jgi:AraC family transcriptional regulator
LAKIALDVERALARRKRDGSPGSTKARTIAAGDGWSVADVVCTCGPDDRPFEEAHARFSIAVVAAGSFQYRSAAGRELMTPGSLMLGSAGQCFECGHEHAAGDRCIAFWYDTAYFERIAAGAGWRGRLRFTATRVPPVRELSPDVARIVAGLLRPSDTVWEEFSLSLAARTIEWITNRRGEPPPAAPAAEARVTRAVRAIDRGGEASAPPTLAVMAREAGLSPFHFIRTFERLTGVTPHQYVRRVRLRDAAAQLAAGRDKVLDVALDTGFGDLSNFNRAFKREFGVSPKVFRRSSACAAPVSSARGTTSCSRDLFPSVEQRP